MRKFYLLNLLFLMALFVHGQKLPFQGKLILDNSPVNDKVAISVSIPSIGWSETHEEVDVKDGLYFIVLGQTNPIPGSIFFAANERQMEISVNGNPLSPVTLYKPLTGDLKELNLKGPGNTALFAGLLPYFQDLPYLGMKGKVPDQGDMVALSVSSFDINGTTYESGSITINSLQGYRAGIGPLGMSVSINNQPVSSFGPQGLWFRDGEVYTAQMMSQNWGNKGFAGQILLRGPNTMNLEIGNKHWENADLPWINMRGATGNGVLNLSGEIYNDEGTDKEMGRITILDTDENKLLLLPREVSLLKPDWNSYARLNSHGNAGNFFLNGPNSENIYLGNKSWENPDLPYFVMKGTENNVIAELSATNDENQNGYLNLYANSGSKSSFTGDGMLLTSQANKRFGAGPDGITLWDANWKRGVFLTSFSSNSPGVRGSLELFGADSPDDYERTVILGTDNQGNGDFGFLHLIGSHAQVSMFDKNIEEKVKLGLTGNDGETGRLSLSGANPHLTLNDANYQSRVFLQTIEGEGGSSGQVEIKGPNTGNFFIGSKSWEDSDLPWFEMYGKDGDTKINMTSVGVEGEERGILTLAGSSREWVTLTNYGTYGSGTFKMQSGAEVQGILTVNGDIEGSGTNSYNSDERLKKDIRPLNTDILGKIESLGGYSYFWKQEEYPQKNFSAEQQIGLLAQELEAQFPALVKTGSDGFKSVNYNGFTAVLLQAVKELNHKVEVLEKENRLLKEELVAASASQKEMNELKSQIEMLARLVQMKIDASGDAQSAENVSPTGLK